MATTPEAKAAIKKTKEVLAEMMAKDIVMRHLGKNRTVAHVAVENVTCDGDVVFIATTHGCFTARIALIEV